MPGYNIVNPRFWGGEAFEVRGLFGWIRPNVPAAGLCRQGLGPQIKWWPVDLAGFINDMIGP